MARKPIIGFITGEGVWEQQRRYVLEAAAVDAVTLVADVTPLMIPPIGALVDQVLPIVDGIYLAGGMTNVYPAQYGSQASEGDGPFDPNRDNAALALARGAVAAGVPLLGSCRGCQEMVVAFGGTLVKENPATPESKKHGILESAKSEAEQYGLRQEIQIRPDSLLFNILRTERTKVNSLHSFLIDDLGPELVAEATAEDGTVEAIRIAAAKNFALGVIFHPDYWVKWDRPSHAIISAFIDAATHHARDREANP